MKKIIIAGGLIFVMAFLGSAYGQVAREFFSGTIDLDSPGDEIREVVRPDGRRNVSHFKVFSIPDLTMEDPPAMTLYRRRCTDRTLTPVGLNEFVEASLDGGCFSTASPPITIDSPLLIFDEGRILLRYRLDIFSPDGELLSVFYSLDSVGGTGDFRLVLIR
ncbi:hypothetical protein EPO44_07225 [bacterium]|nr:MAG: hypothetical protein EPO44_07225 [bacterium]